MTAARAQTISGEPIRIRRFEASDRNACQRIAAEAAMSSYGPLMPERQFAFSITAPLEPAEVRLVASIAQEVVGFVELIGRHISNLFVHPAHQGCGVGASLIAAAEETIPGDLTLSVFTVNPHARRLYERLGYRSDGMSSILFHGVMTDVWSMRKSRP